MEKTKIEKRLEFMNNADNQSEATLYLHGAIGTTWWDDISLKEIQYNLSNKQFDTLHVHINSYGGDVFESIAIGNYLKELNAKVIVYVDAIAASGASVIAMGADEIVMYENSMMMIHQAWTTAAGNAKELRKVADDLDKIGVLLSKTYLGRFVGTEEELVQLLDKEEYITADECIVLGLADSIKGSIQVEDQNASNSKEAILNKYRYSKQETSEETKQETKQETKKETENTFTTLLNLLAV